MKEMQDEVMKAEFEKYHGFTVNDDMDIHTAVAWDSWRIAWSAGVQSTKTPPMFAQVFCSQCGQEFGPGYHGFSHCTDHKEVK